MTDVTDMTEAAPITNDFFAIYSPEARRRDVALLAEALELDVNCDADKFDADKFCAALGAAELAQRRQAALTGQWKVRQDTEMLCAALAKAREELAIAELVALRLAESAGV